MVATDAAEYFQGLSENDRRLLAGERTPAETIDVLLPTIRSDVLFESDQLRDAGFDNFFRIRQSNPVEENVVPLARFLDIPPDQARQIVSADHLFVD